MLAIHNDKVITSPNSDFVPEPFVFDDAVMELKRDGRFGFVDYFQWPQLHVEQYIWSVCIPWQVAYRDDPLWSLVWWNTGRSPSEFVLEQGSAFEVGRVHPSKFRELEAVYQCLEEHATQWAKEHPCYKGHIRVGDWVRCGKRALMRMKVRCCVLVLGMFRHFC